MYKRSLLGAVVFIGLGVRLRRQHRRAGRRSVADRPAGGAVGGGPTPADNMMKASEPGSVRDRLEVLPEHRRRRWPRNGWCASRARSSTLRRRRCCPRTSKTAAMTALPPDPLQTNYEYAANLAFTPANFTPYTKWVEGITASVRANPASVIDCAASSNSTPCLQTAAKKFVGRAVPGDAGGRAARALRRHAHHRRHRGGPARRRRRSGRRHPQLAELRLPRRGADRRVVRAAARRSGCRR